MPRLPTGDYKIVIRPRGGLQLPKLSLMELDEAVYESAEIPYEERETDTICPNTFHNIWVVSTPNQDHAGKYQGIKHIKANDKLYEVGVYDTAPELTDKAKPCASHQAIYRAVDVPSHEAGEDTVCSNNHQNIIVVSTPYASHADKCRQLQDITIGDRHHEVSAYETAPDNTVKGIIKGIPLDEDAMSIHTSIVHARIPYALAAKRLSNTTTIIVAFEGPRVPTYVRYGGALLRCTLYRKQIDMCHCCGRLGHRMDMCPKPKDKLCCGCDAPNPGANHQCSPHCKLCGGAHMMADLQLPCKVQTALHRDEETMGTTQGQRGGGGHCHQLFHKQGPLKILDTQSKPLPIL
ncbi:hypothetical protein HPB51_005657 [Rhipicephalus microplus]|uniref:CCHC-type domain-containing protein n=1 Tax=Rhipicephalus microplus TaxID=6941 RepID=A0A9J6ERM8_RHIMP|nr:hypothetical protein HPB51_005657 [Rhipicephalus microplus]